VASKPPVGWKFGYTNPADGQATWTTAKDVRACSGSNVLTVGTTSADHVFNLAMATATSYQDVNVRTRIRPISGVVDQGGGVIWRCQDENNYYICRINPLESNFRIYKVADGKRKQLQSAHLETSADKWYVVRAKMVGDHITCHVDGKQLLDVHDNTFAGAGMIGLWTKADASSSFDNVAVQPARASKEKHRGELKTGESAKKAEHDEDEDGEDEDEEDDD